VSAFRPFGLAALLLALAAAAQEPSPVRRVDEPPRAKAEVSVGYVLVPVVVLDSKGRPVRDLKQKNMTLLADGRAVATDLFTRSDDAPVSFVVLLDGSGSMALAGKMDGARAAIRALAERRLPGDEFALYVFAEGKAREVVPFTDDVARVKKAVDAVVPFGKTALYDAIAKMPDRSLLGKNGSRAIFLLTDGIDNASTLSEAALTTLLEGVDVPVYPIGLRTTTALPVPSGGQTAEALLNVEVLGHIARMSGGRLEIVTEPEQLDSAVREIEKDLRSQYLLGFSPTASGDVRYHRLSVRISGFPKTLHMRAGYRGTDPPYLEKR
jgi:Ca-activated chloride channel family protein